LNNFAQHPSSILALDQSLLETLGNGIAKTAFADDNDFTAEILHGVFDKKMRAGTTFSKKMEDT
jgi:hypothetical protein